MMQRWLGIAARRLTGDRAGDKQMRRRSSRSCVATLSRAGCMPPTHLRPCVTHSAHRARRRRCRDSSASGARSPSSSARRSARESSARRPASPIGCPVRCRSSRVWVAGGVLALCGALTLAEVAGAFPNTGGIFVFIREGLGTACRRFSSAGRSSSIIRAAALGAIATTFAEYFLRVLGFDPAVAPYDDYVHYIAAVAIAVMAGVQLRRRALGLARAERHDGREVLRPAVHRHPRARVRTSARPAAHFTPAAPPGSFSVAAFGLALVSVLWAYDGWADLTFEAAALDAGGACVLCASARTAETPVVLRKAAPGFSRCAQPGARQRSQRWTCSKQLCGQGPGLTGSSGSWRCQTTR